MRERAQTIKDLGEETSGQRIAGAKALRWNQFGRFCKPRKASVTRVDVGEGGEWGKEVGGSLRGKSF